MKRKYAAIIISTVLALALGGCRDMSMARLEERNAEAGDRAEGLAKLVEDMPGIESAAVVISGKSAAVGIILEGDGESGGEITAVKLAIEEKIKAADPGIERVAVSAAAELYERLLKAAGRKPDEGEAPRENGGGILFRLAPKF